MRWWRPGIALVLALVVQVGVFVITQRDMPADDPVYYAEIAHAIADDPSAAFATRSTHPWEMRIGLTVPLAGLYRAFGVSPITTNLPSLLGACGILIVLFAAGSTARAKVLALVFALTCTALIRHCATLNIDLPCAALMAFTVLCWSRRDRARGTWWLVAAATAWFAAFLVKETAVWLAPVWIFAIASDLRMAPVVVVARRHAPAVLVGVVLAAAYLVLCARIWGDPFARFAGIQELTFHHGWSMHDQPATAWIDRLSWKPAVMLFWMFRALLVPVALAPWLGRSVDRTWLVATFTLVALYWFGSSSLSAYEPLPLWPRMALPLVPGILVVSAEVTDRVIDRLGRVAIFAGALAVVVPAAVTTRGLISGERPETTAFALLHDELAERQVVLVCADVWLPTLARFHFGFAPPRTLTIVTIAELATLAIPPGARVRVIVNLRRDHEPVELRGLRPIYVHPDVRLYEVDSVDLGRLRGNR